MDKIALEIETPSGWQYASLDSDEKIKIENVSEIWDGELTGGAFSHSFSLPIFPNLHILGTIEHIHGDSIYQKLQDKRFRLYVSGLVLLSGHINIDSEVSIDDGHVTIELSSNNKEFSDSINDLNCQDIEIKDRICVGTEVSRIDWQVDIKKDGESVREYFNTSLPSSVFSINQYRDSSGNWINSTNEYQPYPDKAYCNTRICIQHRKKKDDGSYELTREYEVFEADRPNSGLCFYFMYFLDCLFSHLHIPFDNSNLRSFEDMNRVAFFTTRCQCDLESSPESEISYAEFSDKFQVEILHDAQYETSKFFVTNVNSLPFSQHRFANSKNFPDEDVETVLDSFMQAFGFRFSFDSKSQTMQAYYLKDIFSSPIHVLYPDILSVEKQEQRTDCVMMSYGDNDDTSYNYDLSDSPVVVAGSYENIQKYSLNPYDRNAYYDKNTGNLYRIKVDEDAENESELYPSLFEVGQYGDAWEGDKDSEYKETIDIGFTPVVPNVIEYTTSGEFKSERDYTYITQRTSLSSRIKEYSPPQFRYAIFVDTELTDSQDTVLMTGYETLSRSGSGGRTASIYIETSILYKSRFGYSEAYLSRRNHYYGGRIHVSLTTTRKETRLFNKYKERIMKLEASKNPTTRRGTPPLPEYTEDPFQVYDSGFTIGIMRGPGNTSGIEHYAPNYDGEGNSRWQYVSKNSSFHYDMMDNNGQLFDYNGNQSGGIDTSGRCSLSPRSEKVSTYTPSISGSSILLRSKKEYSEWLSTLFPDSAVDLLNMRMTAVGLVTNKLWPVNDSRRYLPIYPILYRHLRHPIGVYTVYLLNVIHSSGEVFSRDYIDQYDAYSDPLKLVIKANATQTDLDNLLNLCNAYYLPEEYPSCQLEDIQDFVGTKYYPIVQSAARRGLFDKFYSEYAYFVLHRKVVTLQCKFNLSELLQIDFSKRYRIGIYTGFIKQLSYTLSMDKGLEDVTVQMYYI